MTPTVRLNKTFMPRKKLIPDYTKLNFANLVGADAILYACPNVPNQFQLGTMVFEAVEDENDGYRSSMDECKVVTASAKTGQQLAIVTINIDKDAYIDGYELKDKSGHVWLRFGTSNTDDYYPSFYFSWTPLEPKELIEARKLIKK